MFAAPEFMRGEAGLRNIKLRISVVYVSSSLQSRRLRLQNELQDSSMSPSKSSNTLDSWVFVLLKRSFEYIMRSIPAAHWKKTCLCRMCHRDHENEKPLCQLRRS
jgi:hypothetical protein